MRCPNGVRGVQTMRVHRCPTTRVPLRGYPGVFGHSPLGCAHRRIRTPPDSEPLTVGQTAYNMVSRMGTRGPKPRPLSERRHILKVVRVRADEAELMEQAAEAKGVSLSEWMRTTLLRSASRTVGR